MGTTRWCRNCSRNTNHSGIGGNWWQVVETGNTVLGCHSCGHLRSVDEPELSEGTEIEHSMRGDVRTVGEDGFLKGEANDE
jgi:hypothetical protein